MLQISQLFIYPIKSLGGIAVDDVLVTDRGLQYDRRFMLVDDNNLFLTQREYPEMALLQTAIEGSNLTVFHKKSAGQKLVLPLVTTGGDSIRVQVWEDVCDALVVGAYADAWFSHHMGFTCRLVYMPDTTKRKVDTGYALNNDITSFSDAFPLLMIGQASLDDLNSRLAMPLPVNRFRPNIVFTGGRPFEEDNMEQFSVNGKSFFCVKPCARCNITTTDQETGITGKEPLRTLATYRVANNKVLFGQNVLTTGTGVITVGDVIDVLKVKTSQLVTGPL